jgi:hypothetical protein
VAICLCNPFENAFELDCCVAAGYSSGMNQTSQTSVGIGAIPLWTGALGALPARAPDPARKELSMKHSITACAVLLGYIAIYMCVGFAALVLVERAWLAVFE